jgi:protein-disulfide isomerase
VLRVCKTLLVILALAAPVIGLGTASASAAPLPERVLGKSDAPVTIIEYASLTCDHCKRFHLQMFPRLKQAYIDTGKAKLIYRHFPLDRVALMASTLTECAPPDQFFGLLDVLFRSEDQWAHSKDPKTELAKIALLAGIRRSAFDACLADDKLSTAIVALRQAGELQHKVNSTPTFIIGDVVLRGVRDVAEIEQAIEKAARR